MADRRGAICGALLAMAVGDAMGYPAERKTLAQMRQDYGPGGLMGFDLLNGHAHITSYTQLAAYTANGLLIGISGGQAKGPAIPLVRQIELACREWARGQMYTAEPEPEVCWLSSVPEMRQPCCMDTMVWDALARGKTGTLEHPRNRLKTAGSLTMAVPIGLLLDPSRYAQGAIHRLGAEAVALTHGNPTAFLSGAMLTHIISRITWGGVTELWQLVRECINLLKDYFSQEYPQAVEMGKLLQMTMELAWVQRSSNCDAMEQLRCDNCSEILAGALYACLINPADFDGVMITAVNHSGRSAAVGAIAGAIAGAMMGGDSVPEFYLESLDVRGALEQLAGDLYQGSLKRGGAIFDDVWDKRYGRAGR